MSDKSEYFSRVRGRVDLGALGPRFVAVVGVGSVGSVMAFELARCGVGHLALIDGDELEIHNVARHALPVAYVENNKAEAMAAHLRHNVPEIDVGALARPVDSTFSDLDLDRLLAPADLVVIATDERRVQRRIAQRALAMDIPAVVPGLYAEGGGEIFVQLGSGQACFGCWDLFRAEDSEVRGVSSINVDALAVIQHAVYLSLALLDPRSLHARELAPPPGDPRPRQLFVLRPGAAVLRAPAARRPGCPSCAVGPSPINPMMAGRESDAARRHAARRARNRDAAAGWELGLDGTERPPTIEPVEVDERLVVEGTPVTLTWRASNATHVEIETLGRRPPSGQDGVVVERTRAFRVRAINPFGTTEVLSPVVRAIPLPRLRPPEPPTFPAVAAPVTLSAPSLPPLSAPSGANVLAIPRVVPTVPLWPLPLWSVPADSAPRRAGAHPTRRSPR